MIDTFSSEGESKSPLLYAAPNMLTASVSAITRVLCLTVCSMALGLCGDLTTGKRVALDAPSVGC